MLSSITPLGERSRGFSWRVTVTAFVIGSLAAGTAGGALLGGLGALLPAGGNWRSAALLVAVAALLLMETPALRGRLPTTRRQVNEDWLTRFRGWVYGVGFGAQLGLGVVTIVTSPAIYICVVVAVLSSNVLAGLAIGATFGLIRGLMLVPAGSARDTVSLFALHGRLEASQVRIRRVTLAAEVLVAALTVLAV